MATTITRRPLPALISLVALLVLAAIVWWRVLSRDSGSHPAAKPTPSHTTSCPTPAAPTATLAAPSSATVKILNSTDRAGIAAKARDALIADGFHVPDKAGNDKPTVSIPATAEIRYGPAGGPTATLLRYYFPGSRLVRLKTTSADVVVSLGDKYKAVATPAAVKADMARNRVTVSAGSTPTPTGSSSPMSSSASAAPSPSPSC